MFWVGGELITSTHTSIVLLKKDVSPPRNHELYQIVLHSILNLCLIHRENLLGCNDILMEFSGGDKLQRQATAQTSDLMTTVAIRCGLYHNSK